MTAANLSESLPWSRSRFLVVFLSVQLVLFTLEMLQPVRDHLIDPFTRSLAWLLGMLIQWVDSSVTSEGIYLLSSRNEFILRIEAGCNGVEPMIILAAAILAFPSTWRDKAAGLSFGLLGIQALNLVRIISLFYVGQWSMQAYDWAHLYIWQALILLDAFIVWILWVRYLNRGITD